MPRTNIEFTNAQDVTVRIVKHPAGGGYISLHANQADCCGTSWNYIEYYLVRADMAQILQLFQEEVDNV